MRRSDMNGYMNVKHLEAHKYKPQLLRHFGEHVRLVLNHAPNAQEGHHALTAPRGISCALTCPGNDGDVKSCLVPLKSRVLEVQ